MGERVLIFRKKNKKKLKKPYTRPTENYWYPSLCYVEEYVADLIVLKLEYSRKIYFNFGRGERRRWTEWKKGLARLCLPSMFISGLTSYTNAYAIKMCVVISTRISKEEKQMAIFPSRSRNPSFQVKYSMSRDTWASFSTLFCYLYSGSVAFSFKTAWGQREIVSIKSRAAACYQRSSWMADITDIGKYIIMNRL